LGDPSLSTAFILNYDFIPSFGETGAHYPSPVSGTLWITQQYFIGFKEPIVHIPYKKQTNC
jgi:hypothetical protein